MLVQHMSLGLTAALLEFQEAQLPARSGKHTTKSYFSTNRGPSSGRFGPACTAVDCCASLSNTSGHRGKLLQQPHDAALCQLTGTQVLYNAAAAQPLFCNVRTCRRACVHLAQSWLCSTAVGASHCKVAGRLGEQLSKEVGYTVASYQCTPLRTGCRVLCYADHRSAAADSQ